MSNFFSFVFLLGLFLSVTFGIFQMLKGINNILFNKAYSRRYPVGEGSIVCGGSADFDCSGFKALSIDLGRFCSGSGDGSS